MRRIILTSWETSARWLCFDNGCLQTTIKCPPWIMKEALNQMTPVAKYNPEFDEIEIILEKTPAQNKTSIKDIEDGSPTTETK